MQKINFQNLPSTSTPLNATNMNAIQTNVENAIQKGYKGQTMTYTNIDGFKDDIITNTYPNGSYIIDLSLNGAGSIAIIEKASNNYLSFFTFSYSGNITQYQYLNGTWNTIKYEDVKTGTFTPTVFGGTTAGTATYNLREGHYAKVGKIVHFEIRIGCTLTGSSGLLLIGGIPNLGSYYEPSAMNVVSTLSGIIGEPLCTRTYDNNLLLDTYGINPLNNRNWDSTNYIYVSGTMLLR